LSVPFVLRLSIVALITLLVFRARAVDAQVYIRYQLYLLVNTIHQFTKKDLYPVKYIT